MKQRNKKKANKKWHKAIEHKETILRLSKCLSISAMQEQLGDDLLPFPHHSSHGCSPDVQNLYLRNANGTSQLPREPAVRLILLLPFL